MFYTLSEMLCNIAAFNTEQIDICTSSSSCQMTPVSLEDRDRAVSVVGGGRERVSWVSVTSQPGNPAGALRLGDLQVGRIISPVPGPVAGHSGRAHGGWCLVSQALGSLRV